MTFFIHLILKISVDFFADIPEKLYFLQQKYILRYEWNRRKRCGGDSQVYYYHQFKENMPFFIDFAFTNIQTFAYEIGKWDKTEAEEWLQASIRWVARIFTPIAKRTMPPKSSGLRRRVIVLPK